MNPQQKATWNAGYWVLAFLLVLWFQNVWQTARTVEPVPYSAFEQALAEGRVAEVIVSDTTITGRLKAPDASGKTVIVANRVEPDLAERLGRYEVPYTRVVENTWLRDVLSWVAPTLVFFALWFFVVRRVLERQGMGGFMSIGKSRAKVYVEANTGVTFADVAGVDEAKAELQEIVAFLKDPQGYGRLGARAPKGVLLVGPPGTGKTLLAKAVAGEAGVPFFSISGSEFVEMFVGVGAARVRDLFEQARAKAPAIIFIDELDALGRARGAGGPIGGHDEREQTLNQLLVELDGFDSASGLVLLAATNRPEILDPALLRAGRFDRQVLVDRPDKAGRVQILRVHARKIRLAPDVDLEQIAALTPGFSGADLANLCNEAALAATRRGAEAVTLADFTAAIERIVAGLEKKNRLLNPREREIVAYHEMGHALVALVLPGTDPVHKVSIIPRGIGALGYTIQRPTEDRYLMTREELERKLMVLLGGRAAEKLVFGHLSTGAADDIAKATDIARDMVMRYGMEESLGYIAYEAQRPQFLDVPGLASGGCPRSPETQARIDEAVRRIVMDAFARATEILQRHRDVLERCARELLQRETLDEAQLQALTAPVRAASAPEPA
ncbi:ATP-dependent zinc metalloprotease FtsH [Tepidimonas taiwanensis]|uniref:ATP-dependent zinc metalloprotease FtsH n=1 Tax=Tepidimonas taiwanensis TaxID=307486 RepID=A0A554X7A5_9BURK|nr:ATP-dependent zinc metalloprotease FtsH [Tepidimonas taiwanensis]TSE31712.1 ATP-dependent zinc metalloprotease FtsH 4 [Tepidimonas taiwanensis]UBQ05359.1 ATP-dependent zinc metalloprotease FtsH [Tepidimonas taiwanensis]